MRSLACRLTRITPTMWHGRSSNVKAILVEPTAAQIVFFARSNPDKIMRLHIIGCGILVSMTVSELDRPTDEERSNFEPIVHQDQCGRSGLVPIP